MGQKVDMELKSSVANKVITPHSHHMKYKRLPLTHSWWLESRQSAHYMLCMQ